jgi:cytoskeleton protein RodZ
MDNIGRVLKEERVARGLEIGDIARRTCISAHYLKDMEEGRFNRIPSVFDRGYLKIYANFLALDTKPLLAMLEEEKRERQAPQYG